MFRPPFLARVAAGAAVYALEETRRLPTAAVNFPITAISQMLQTTMHVQQFVTSLALKGDDVFDRLSATEDQPEWATFDEDNDTAAAAAAPTTGSGFAAPTRNSPFDLFSAGESELDDAAISANGKNGHPISAPPLDDPSHDGLNAAQAPAVDVAEPAVATRYDYANMTLAQLRARLRMLTVEDLAQLLDYEQQTQARAPFVTMLTNRIATVQAQ